jgi:hypothetical protein
MKTWTTYEDAKIPAMLRELASDLAEMVRTGDLTDTEANEWLSSKADQWAGGLS